MRRLRWHITADIPETNWALEGHNEVYCDGPLDLLLAWLVIRKSGIPWKVAWA